jgi:ABC-type molybdate transport system substrate-binding protein
MKKPLKKASRANYSLGDLILAVSSYSRNSQETVAAVADLLDTGRVRLGSRGHAVRARVC